MFSRRSSFRQRSSARKKKNETEVRQHSQSKRVKVVPALNNAYEIQLDVEGVRNTHSGTVVSVECLVNPFYFVDTSSERLPARQSRMRAACETATEACTNTTDFNMRTTPAIRQRYRLHQHNSSICEPPQNVSLVRCSHGACVCMSPLLSSSHTCGGNEKLPDTSPRALFWHAEHAKVRVGIVVLAVRFPRPTHADAAHHGLRSVLAHLLSHKEGVARRFHHRRDCHCHQKWCTRA